MDENQSSNNPEPEESTPLTPVVPTQEPIEPAPSKTDPASPDASQGGPSINPYNTEITPPVQNPTIEKAPPYDGLPHKPHHFVTKKAVILGALFILTALASSFVTFSLVNSRMKNTTPAPMPVAKATPTPDPMAGWQTYTDPEGEYTFKYPSTWQIKLPTPGTPEAVKLSTPGTDLDTLANASQPGYLALFVANTPTEFSVSPTGNQTIQGISMIENWKEITVGGRVAHLYKTAGGCNGPCSTNADIPSSDQTIISLRLYTGDDPAILEQILGTFTFTSPSEAGTPAGTGACTLDAKICSDGSSVGRVPPSCEFAACPQ